MRSYVKAEGLEGWRASPLATMHVEATKAERKWVTLDPVAEEDEKTQGCLQFRLRCSLAATKIGLYEVKEYSVY